MRPRPSPAHAVDSARHDVGEVDGLGRSLDRLVAGELDQVADQSRQLLDLGRRVGEDLVVADPG